MAELTLDMLKNQTEEEILLSQTDGEVLYELSKLAANLFCWFPFEKGAQVLEVNAGCGTITRMLCEKELLVTAIESNPRYAQINAYRNQKYISGQLQLFTDASAVDVEQTFDYILMRKGVTEVEIAWAKAHLKSNGTLMIAVDNRYGLSRFVASPATIHTGKQDSATRPQLTEWLLQSGFVSPVFYYPFPDYRLPVEIYSDNCWPGPGALREDFVGYMQEQTGFMDEPAMFDKICEDGLYQQFANSFLVIAGCVPEMIYGKFNSLRNPKFRTWVQILQEDNQKKVYKGMLEESAHLSQMLTNYTILCDLYQKVRPVAIEAVAEEKKESKQAQSFSIPFVQGQALLEDCDFLTISEEELKARILQALAIISDVKEENKIPFEITPEFTAVFKDCRPQAQDAYKIANMDSIFSNFICDENQIWCIDYEWVFSFPVPVNFVAYRAVLYLYKDHMATFMQREITVEKLMQMAGIQADEQTIYKQMELCFQEYVHGENLKYIYTQRYKKNRFMVEQLPKLLGDKDNHIHNLEEIIAAQRNSLDEIKHAMRNPFYGIRLLLRRKRK